MKVRVQYSAQLQTVAGRSEEEIELPEGSNLGGLLNLLAERHGAAAAPHLLASATTVSPSLLVVVNGSASAARDAATRTLESGDIVLLLPPIAGG